MTSKSSFEIKWPLVATFFYASVFAIHAYLAALKKHQHKNEYVNTSAERHLLYTFCLPGKIQLRYLNNKHVLHFEIHENIRFRLKWRRCSLDRQWCHREILLGKTPRNLCSFCGGTVNSWFKKVHFSFLKSRVVWFKKDLCSESKNWLSEKNTYYVGEFTTCEIFLKSRVICTMHFFFQSKYYLDTW